MTKQELKDKFKLEDIDFHEEQLDDHIVVKKSGVRKIREKIGVYGISYEVKSYVVGPDGKGHAVVTASGAITKGQNVITHEETGEASPENNSFPYPVAVAQKRAESRLVLRMAGVDRVISDIELDSVKWFKEQALTDRIGKAIKGNKR